MSRCVMSNDETIFEYTELAHRHDIRLLRLEGSTSYPRQGPIKGKLEHVSLDDFVNGNTISQYDAISYCWGDPAPADRIWLSENTYLHVNASAAHVLRYFSWDRDIWIDSVCINQRDDNEKSRQVMMMWGIYNFAERVVVWLGGPEDDAKLAMKLICDAAHPETTKYIWGRDPVWLPTRLPTNERFCSFHYDARAWCALVKLLERPWFRRVWTIREIVAAKNAILICSNDSGLEFVLWGHLAKVVEHLQSEGHLHLLEMKDSNNPLAHPMLPRGVERVQKIQMYRRTREPQSLQENLILTATAEASDSRDKIFALGTLSRGTDVEPLLPQYHLSACEVFTNATKYMITHDKSILVFHIAGIGWMRSQKDLPSWVPDYSCHRHSLDGRSECLILGQIAVRALYSAGSHFTCDEPAEVVTWPSLPHAVGVSGLVIDMITEVCYGLPRPRSIWKSLTAGTYSDRKEILSWFNNVRKKICPRLIPEIPYFNGKALSLFDAFWCTMVVGIDHKDFVLRQGQTEGRELFDAFLALLLHTVSSRDDSPNFENFDESQLEKASKYVQVLD